MMLCFVRDIYVVASTYCKGLTLHDLVNFSRHNTEKVVYFLLLDRKLRNPSIEDDVEIKSKTESGK